jgi:hypothetical protein
VIIGLSQCTGHHHVIPKLNSQLAALQRKQQRYKGGAGAGLAAALLLLLLLSLLLLYLLALHQGPAWDCIIYCTAAYWSQGRA